jgi:citronellol/citronellal dehydrogenase
MEFAGRTFFVTGGSRGIGRAIALMAAEGGANVVIAAKTDEPHPKLPGTIHSVAAEIEAKGGHALPLRVDLRDEAGLADAVSAAVARFGGIDVLVNNASAIQLTPTLQTPMKKFDLMFGVNVRGTFAASQACLPHLLKSPRAHVVTLSPPLDLDPQWFGGHVAYTMSKYGMSMCTLGMAREFAGKVAFNSLWPRTTIATAAVNMLGGAQLLAQSRTERILADAVRWIVQQPVTTSGNFYLDEDLLRAAGVSDFSGYAVDPTQPLATDLFVRPR